MYQPVARRPLLFSASHQTDGLKSSKEEALQDEAGIGCSSFSVFLVSLCLVSFCFFRRIAGVLLLYWEGSHGEQTSVSWDGGSNGFRVMYVSQLF